MLNDFTTEYSERSDDELLHLASARHSLTTEAAAALDAELRRRNLIKSDRIEYQRSVKRAEAREARRHRRKPLEPFKFQMSWRDILWAFATTALISVVYIALPGRYHLKSEWALAAFVAVMMSVLIVFGTRNVFLRSFSFWTSLVVAAFIDLTVLHSWTERGVRLNRGAAVLGLVVFLAVYWIVRVVQRIFHG